MSEVSAASLSVCAALGTYYTYWEQQIFAAIHAAVLRGLHQLASALNARSPSEGPHGSNPIPGPLLKVQMLLLSSWPMGNDSSLYKADERSSSTSLCMHLTEGALQYYPDGQHQHAT